MAVYLDDIKDMKLTRTPFYLPINEENKRMGSAIFLLTPNIVSSINLMKHPLTINKRLFESYYLEKNISFIINEYGQYTLPGVGVIDESVADFNMVPDDSFAIHEGYADVRVDGQRSKYLFMDEVEHALTEAANRDGNFSFQLKKLLYSERIKNQKECALIYDKIKEADPFIRYTYLKYSIYKQKNLFIDWSYYTEFFFKNNIYKLDKGVNLYFAFINKFLNDARLSENGYKVKTVFVPIQDWVKPDFLIYDYTKDINPISIIYRIIKSGDELLIQEKWKDLNFVFMSDKAYFKLNFNEFGKHTIPMFTNLINKLSSNDVADAEYDSKDSSKVITHNIIDKIEGSGITINNLTGGTTKVSKEEIKDKVIKSGSPSSAVADQTGETKENVDKAALVQHVKDIADKSSDEDNAMENLNTDVNSDWLKNLIVDLQSEDGPNINKARVGRMSNAYNDFLSKKINNSTVEDLISSNRVKADLPVDNIPIKSINEEWKSVKFTNFSKEYNLDGDIYASLAALNNKSNPIVIVDVKQEDTSTSEDYIITWTIKCEDINGKRFTLKLDVPKFINNRFMKLRGNMKVMNGQLVLLPIIKTDSDTAQIVSSSYNKIFIRRVNPSNGSKTDRNVSILTKFLKKYDGKDMTIVEGDNSFTCSKYDLPIEYVDLAGLYNRLEFKDGSYISFDMDELMSKPLLKGCNPELCRFYADTTGKVQTTGVVAASIMSIIEDKLGSDTFAGIKPDKRLSYSEASILNTDIPVIVVMSYNEGLQTAMQKANINFSFQEKRPAYGMSYIKFNDGYITYVENPSSSLLMSGLAGCNTEDYSIKDINKKEMWLDFLDNFGGRIKADGLDNFYDCMFDPITVEICKSYNLPSDYVTALAYASDLLIDNKYNKHTDISGNRMRTNEIVAAYVDKTIAKAYGDYCNMLKRNKKDATMSVKQSAVIDGLLTDNTCSDLSVLNSQLEAEAGNTFGFKGISGMNSDRSYSLDKRTYDKSMFGVLATSTGFAANVGITRQAAINSSIKGVRGMIATPKKQDVGTLNILSVYEALHPFSTTSDDAIRTSMGFIQSTKHQMRVKISHPNLVTTGMDEALPYMTSDIFSYKFKGKKGKVIEVTKDWIVYEDTDTKVRDYISLKDTVMKNSDGGFFVTVKLDANVKKGQILKNNDILAYDKHSYSDPVGKDKTDTAIAYNTGTTAKIAILPTNEGYEDSAVIDEYLSDALTSTYCVKKDRSLPKDTNVYNMVKVGQPVQEGDPLIIFQNAFEEKDANALLRSITDDDIEAVSDLGRIHLRSKLTGWIQDIKIYRTCEIDELSPSLKKIVTEYEKGIKSQKALFKKYNIKDRDYELEPDYKLPKTGKLKGTDNGVLIEFYINCEDKMGIGDKLVYNNAIKGTVKKIIPAGDEPRTSFRPDEPVDALLTTSAVNARMVASIIKNGSINKGLIELDRWCKDKLGIKWNNLKDMN